MYTSRPRTVNLDAAPAVPQMVWSFERRRDMSLERCRDERKHKGRARRHRREVNVRDSLDYLAALRRGEPCILVPGARRRSLNEVLAYQGPDAPRWVLHMQDQARRLIQLATKHGPASGWGIVQPERKRHALKQWTPYWVPKTAEKCWRWWRACVLTLARLLVRLARALDSLVPLHRAPREATPAEERHVKVERRVTTSYVGAGTSASWIGDLLGRVLGPRPTM